MCYLDSSPFRILPTYLLTLTSRSRHDFAVTLAKDVRGLPHTERQRPKPATRLMSMFPLIFASVGLVPDGTTSGTNHRQTIECVDIESCAACVEARCAFTSGACTAGPVSDMSVCCAADPTKAKGDSWLCADECNTCTCDNSGAISAKGCDTMSPAQPRHLRLNSELVLVALALVPAVLCILAFVGIVFLCFCYRKKAKALSRKELDRDEEADQLAAGD